MWMNWRNAPGAPGRARSGEGAPGAGALGASAVGLEAVSHGLLGRSPTVKCDLVRRCMAATPITMMAQVSPECTCGGIVSSMATQLQAQAVPLPAVPEAALSAWREAAGRAGGAAALEPWDYMPAPPFILDDDGYLIADSMSQNERHYSRLAECWTVLRHHFRGRGGAVCADLSMPLRTNASGRWPSEVLGLELCVREGLPRLFGPVAGEFLHTLDEESAQTGSGRTGTGCGGRATGRGGTSRGCGASVRRRAGGRTEGAP